MIQRKTTGPVTVDEINQLQALNQNQPITLGKTLALLKERKMQIDKENEERKRHKLQEE